MPSPPEPGFRRRVQASLARVPAPLVALLVVAATASAAWSVALTPLTAFDEADHVAYVARFAATGQAPEPTTGEKTYPEVEGYAYPGPLGLLRVVGNRDSKPPWQDEVVRPFEEFVRRASAKDYSDGDGPNPLGKNPPGYYAPQALVWKVTAAGGGGLFARVTAMRVYSALLLLAAVTFTWAAAAQLFVRVLPRVVAAGVVALQPIAEHASALVNPDVQLLAVWSAFTWLALLTVRRGPSIGRFAGLAAATSVSLLTHGRGLAAVPALLVVVAAVLVRHRAARGAVLRASLAAAAILGVAAATYVWFSRSAGSGRPYGGEVNFGPAGQASVTGFLSFVWQFYLPTLPGMSRPIGPAYDFTDVWVRTAFSSFGSYEVVLGRTWLRVIEMALHLLAVIGLALAIVRRSDVVRRVPEVVVLAGTGAATVALLHLASYRALLGGSDDPLITGRYLLPALPVLACAAGALVAALPRRTGLAFAATLLVALTASSLAGIGMTFERFHA